MLKQPIMTRKTHLISTLSTAKLKWTHFISTISLPLASVVKLRGMTCSLACSSRLAIRKAGSWVPQIVPWYYYKCHFAMNSHVRLLVGLLDGRLVGMFGRSLCRDFLKGQKIHFHTLIAVKWCYASKNAFLELTTIMFEDNRLLKMTVNPSSATLSSIGHVKLFCKQVLRDMYVVRIY